MEAGPFVEVCVAGDHLSIAAFEAEGLDPIDSAQHRHLLMGRIYPTPYAAQHLPMVTHSYGLDVGASVARLLQEQGLRTGRAIVRIRLTPALPGGQVRPLARRVFEKTGALEVEAAVGLSPAAWSNARPLRRRLMLVESIVKGTQAVASAEGWGPDVFDAVLRALREEQEELVRVRDDRHAVVRIPPDLLEPLTLRRWDALEPRPRDEVVHAVDAALRASGRWMQLVGVEPFGPQTDLLRIARWKDEHTGSHFSLIPGGDFRPGYDDAGLARYADVYRRLYSLRICHAEEEGEPDGFRCRPEAVDLYDSDRHCDLRQKPPVRVGPMLVSSEPLLHGQAAAEPVLRHVRSRVYGDSADPWTSLSCYWGEVGPLLRRYGWTLPSSAELEWAIRGGREGLFYWGDEPHKAMLAFHSEEVVPEKEGEEAFEELLHGRFEPGRPRRWPWVNRFGLSAVLAHSTWCLPAEDLDDPHPLVTRGGAAMCFPWQYCGEWELLLTAAERRGKLDDMFAKKAVLRGVIRLR